MEISTLYYRNCLVPFVIQDIQLSRMVSFCAPGILLVARIFPFILQEFPPRVLGNFILLLQEIP